MNTKIILGVIVAVGLVVTGVVMTAGQSERTQVLLEPDNTQLVAQGAVLYSKNCASCHGAQLQGQFNWRQRGANGRLPAPPHDASGHTWHHPDEYMFQVTKYGLEKVMRQRYPNDMPAYEDLLSDEEIIATLSFIKSTWPPKVRLRHKQIDRKGGM